MKNKLRLANKNDWDFILTLKNEKRKFNTSDHVITKKEHYAYMKKQEKNPNFYHYFFNESVYVVVNNYMINVIVLKKYRYSKLKKRNLHYGTKAILELQKIHPTLYCLLDLKNTISLAMFYKVSKILNSKN